MASDLDDLELTGLTEEELAELSEFIDPDVRKGNYKRKIRKCPLTSVLFLPAE